MSKAPTWYVSIHPEAKDGERRQRPQSYGPFDDYYEAEDWAETITCPSHTVVHINRLDPIERFKASR